jgi:hypothetical protein
MAFLVIAVCDSPDLQCRIEAALMRIRAAEEGKSGGEGRAGGPVHALASS